MGGGLLSELDQSFLSPDTRRGYPRLQVASQAGIMYLRRAEERIGLDRVGTGVRAGDGVCV